MRTIDFQDDTVRLIDQTRLPHELDLVECHTSSDLAQAIRSMQVRGAMAIGVAAAFGMALGAREYQGDDPRGFLMYLEQVAANGDVANKIGTYTLAVLSKENGIPFYVAAPTSTIDLSVATGADIPIEERSSEEVTHFAGWAIAPEGIAAAHPAFDVTPARYVTAIITEQGILTAPFGAGLRGAVEAASEDRGPVLGAHR